MSEFAQEFQPYMEKLDLKSPEDLAQRLREAGLLGAEGNPIEDQEVRGWLEGTTGEIDAVDLLTLEDVLNLSHEQTMCVLEAAIEDVRRRLGFSAST
jgi:hypothetical protein